jgi:hypothetical protein
MIFYLALDDEGRRQLRGTQADAKAVNRNFEQIDIPTDKAGLMAFVQELYNEIDNSGTHPGDPDLLAPEPEPVLDPRPVPVVETYTATSVSLDEQFAKLPLAHKLHFAALAMEDARERL